MSLSLWLCVSDIRIAGAGTLAAGGPFVESDTARQEEDTMADALDLQG